jgi:sensor histidine kinase regulating citrate/malate metabolism
VAILVQDSSVTMEDEGPGVPSERVATLFDRPNDHRAAHGRGLALARRLAESDGGRLELVQPSPPIFRLTLVPVSTASAGVEPQLTQLRQR